MSPLRPRRSCRARSVTAGCAAAALLVAVAAPLAAAETTAASTAASSSASWATPSAAGDVAAEPWIVTVGDSYISGEGGRWAGTSNRSTTYADALGPTAYFDNGAGTAETIPGCHRSRSAEVFIGGGVGGMNLACSGAAAATTLTPEAFKPGLDFFDDGKGHRGQAALLQDFAAGHDVDAVAVSIGGNDFEFGTIVAQCVENFLLSLTRKNLCSDDRNITAIFSPSNIAAVRADVVTSLTNVATAMRNAGYQDTQWTLLVQTYPSPLPRGVDIRYGQKGLKRQTTGGCGFWNADADWANDTALATINDTVRGAVQQSGLSNARVLDLSSAFTGRRLCERTVGLYEERGLTSWRQPSAVDQTEWVGQVRTDDSGPYEMQESLHPNYWAQLATRSCLRQAYNAGAVRGGTCAISGTGLTAAGEPRMQLR